jgi:hypothetical protein
MAAFVGWLSLRERGADRLQLSLSAIHRVTFAILTVIAVFILFTGVLFEGESTVFLPRNTVAGILVIIMLFGLLYEERWTFDRAAGRVENRFGVVFLARRRVFPLADLERVALDRFTRGRIADEPPGPGAGGTSSNAAGGRAAGPFFGALRPARRRWGEQRIVRLVAVARAGDVHVLDAGPAHKLPQFRGRAMRIAEFCGVRFVDATVGG